jgi:hypothetical protein
MIIDYIEMEVETEETTYYIGVNFDDEPDELYVVVWQKPAHDLERAPCLWFNGADCQYVFSELELEQLRQAINALYSPANDTLQ